MSALDHQGIIVVVSIMRNCSTVHILTIPGLHPIQEFKNVPAHTVGAALAHSATRAKLSHPVSEKVLMFVLTPTGSALL